MASADLSQEYEKKQMCALLMHHTMSRALQGRAVAPENTADMQHALALAEEINDPALTIATLAMMGEVEAMQGNASAECHLTQALALANQFHIHNQVLCLLGEIALQREDVAQAETVLHKAWQRAQTQTIPEYLSRIQIARGELFLAKQQMEAANTALQESLRSMPEDNPLLKARALFGSARVAAEKGQVHIARNQGEHAQRILEGIGHYQATAIQAWLTLLEP